MREPEVEASVRTYLTGKGYEVWERAQMVGVDILAKKGDKMLAVEVKGDRSGHDPSGRG
jgi:Holliday junction resolvase-like predicted endonuclease